MTASACQMPLEAAASQGGKNMMKTFPGFSVAIALALTLAVAGAAQAKPQQATTAQIHQLLRETGAAKLMHSMMGQMMASVLPVMSKAAPCVPQSYWQNFGGADAESDLVNKIIPIYQRHFTQDDIDGLLKFYRTPLGQKLVRVQPEIASESMEIGQTWGRSRMQQMVDKLKQDGTLDAQGKCPAPKSLSKPLGK